MQYVVRRRAMSKDGSDYGTAIMMTAADTEEQAKQAGAAAFDCPIHEVVAEPYVG